LEYDFIVAPGIDPRVIQLSLTDSAGQQLLAEITAAGDLFVRVADSTVHLRKPLIYQEINGVRREIAGSYAFLNTEHSAPNTQHLAQNTQQVSFQVAAYDVSKPLIIDPVWDYSTYLAIDNDCDGVVDKGLRASTRGPENK
jgi:hypothetical protein